jgi:hypothetical protein
MRTHTELRRHRQHRRTADARLPNAAEMRRTRAGRVALIASTAALLVAQEVVAGIDFTGGALVNVAPKPAHMVAGELTYDGLTDIVVVSPASREVDVFVADPSSASHLALRQALALGDMLDGAALGDLNADGRQDLVVVDAGAPVVWVLLGNGDGTFAEPYSISVQNAGTLSAVSVGNFDDTGHPDLAVADRALGRVFILRNDNGAPPCFLPGGEFAVGPDPRQIVTADFNGDAKPDLATLDIGGSLGNDVSIALLRGTTQGIAEFEPPVAYAVGAKPSNLVVADFTNDGLPDLAMINQSTAGGLGEIDVLVNSGGGVYLPPNIIEVPCPFFTGGTSCRPLTLAQGDFDGNGFIDLMVGMLDPRGTAGGVGGTISDAMQAFAGRGDGTFVPGGVFTIQRAPVSMVTGMITGSGKVDLAVADRSTLTLQAFANVSEPGGHYNGDSCVVGDECLSSACTDGVCCATPCQSGEVCNVPGRAGACTRIPSLPVPCTVPDHAKCAADQFCIDGYCCDEPCLDGRCDRAGFLGVCSVSPPVGEPCESAECFSSSALGGESTDRDAARERNAAVPLPAVGANPCGTCPNGQHRRNGLCLADSDSCSIGTGGRAGGNLFVLLWFPLALWMRCRGLRR